MLRFRTRAIACGYEDGDDCDALRADPLFKLASGRALESGRDLDSQPTMSRLEERAVSHRRGAHDGGAGRPVLPQLRGPSRRHHARYRPHLRCRARPPAALALPCPLTRAASCPYTSTMWKAASRWRFSCARAGPPASASTSPRPAQTPFSSACSQAVSPQQALECRGGVPRKPSSLRPQPCNHQPQIPAPHSVRGPDAPNRPTLTSKAVHE